MDRARHSRPDAIVVPATRPASALAGVIQLAADLQTPIVVLCSRQAKLDQVAERIGRVIGARGIVVQLDEGYQLPGLTLETSSDRFASVSAERSSDLSVKRNVGLLLARLHGWRKIVFIDDDITVSAQDMTRLGHRLDSYRIAGMACREYPDNSVFCHARRLAEMPQDVFVTGAVLGVNCSDLPLPFFPDIYNEDWFFFADAAAHRQLIKVGDARQAPYDPFATPVRARHEEFGDLLAEGLYALIENPPPVSFDAKRGQKYFPTFMRLPTAKYWSTAIDVRRHDLAELRTRLEEFTWRESCGDDVFAALRSLEAADERYDENENDPITPQHCVDLLESWQRDIVRWNEVYQGTNIARTTGDALKRLQLENWTSVRLTPAAASSVAAQAEDQPAARIRFPNNVRPDSAVWELYTALGELHERAGRPNARDVGMDLGMSPRRVYDVFLGEPGHLDRLILLRIVAMLARLALASDVGDVLDRFDVLWSNAFAARDERGPLTGIRPPATRLRGERPAPSYDPSVSRLAFSSYSLEAMWPSGGEP